MTPEQSTKYLSASMDRLIDTAMRVKAERDELLGALQGLIDAGAGNDDFADEWERARAAISKATGA